MTETKKNHIFWNSGDMVKCSCPSFWQFNVKSKTKVVWRSCNVLKIVLHGKVIFTRNSCLDSQIEIPAFFFGFQLCFYFTY